MILSNTPMLNSSISRTSLLGLQWETCNVTGSKDARRRLEIPIHRDAILSIVQLDAYSR